MYRSLSVIHQYDKLIKIEDLISHVLSLIIIIRHFEENFHSVKCRRYRSCFSGCVLLYSSTLLGVNMTPQCVLAAYTVPLFP